MKTVTTTNMSSRHPTDKKRGNNTRFKVTRTLTDSDGKSRIETLEMSDEDALEVRRILLFVSFV